MQHPPWLQKRQPPNPFWWLLSLLVVAMALWVACSGSDSPALRYCLFLSIGLLAARASASERERLRREEFRRNHDFDKEFKIK